MMMIMLMMMMRMRSVDHLFQTLHDDDNVDDDDVYEVCRSLVSDFA